jgi:hypothetical protein
MLVTVAQVPVLGSLTWASISSMASAPFCPMSEAICSNTMPRTASAPKTSPAIEMMRKSIGAIENME